MKPPNDLEVEEDEGTATGATIEEPTVNTAGSNEDGFNDATADANSTPQPPSAQMRFDSFESAKEHYRAYAQRKGFGIRIDWSRDDAKKELASSILYAQEQANLTNQKKTLRIQNQL